MSLAPSRPPYTLALHPALVSFVSELTAIYSSLSLHDRVLLRQYQACLASDVAVEEIACAIRRAWARNESLAATVPALDKSG